MVSVNIPFLLDTKSGKIWELNQGKFSGVTVEGLAYDSNDLEKFYNEIQKMNITDSSGVGVSERQSKAVKDALISEFSYLLDKDKSRKIFDENIKK